MKKFLLAIVSVLLLLSSMAAAEEVTTVILVRHGETDYNRQGRYQGFLDIPLNENGLEQARMLAESLKDTHIDVFIASPLQRAYITTKMVADMHGKPIAYTDARLKEINYGDWAGAYKADLAEDYPKQYKKWIEKPWKVTMSNGEGLKDIQRRYREALDDAVERYPGKVIFIGAHSVGNAALLCELFDVGLDHYNSIRQDNTCVNVLELRDGKWRVVLMNSVTHLGYLYKGARRAA